MVSIETLRIENGDYSDILMTISREDVCISIKNESDVDTVKIDLNYLKDFIEGLNMITVCRAEPAKEADPE